MIGEDEISLLFSHDRRIAVRALPAFVQNDFDVVEGPPGGAEFVHIIAARCGGQEIEPEILGDRDAVKLLQLGDPVVGVRHRRRRFTSPPRREREMSFSRRNHNPGFRKRGSQPAQRPPAPETKDRPREKESDCGEEKLHGASIG
jgi:hypothetical protein